jgi:hypothetical protein
MEARSTLAFRQSKRAVTLPPTRHLKIFLTFIAAVAVLVIDAMTPIGLAVWLLQVVLVWAATQWANPREIIGVAVVCATFIILGFCLSAQTGPTTWVDHSNLLLGLGTVSVLTHNCLRRITVEDARRKAVAELGQLSRLLSGILPVCAWCRKIRNECGVWEPLEIYISKHSHAEFTHGVCEGCVARFKL